VAHFQNVPHLCAGKLRIIELTEVLKLAEPGGTPKQARSTSVAQMTTIPQILKIQ
jgi:hypothetical protein